MFYRNRRSQPQRKGVAAVELAVLLPFLCFLLIVAVDFARIFYFSLTVTNCARNGAQYGSQSPVYALDTSGIAKAATMDAGNLNPNLLTVSSTTDSSTNPTYVNVTVSYPFTTITSFPGVNSTTTLTRTVRMLVVPLVPNFTGAAP
jgi:Flp pilus assembly protein TadG